MIEETTLNAYCIFCRTGAERSVAHHINQNFPEVTAIAPVKILPEKRHGQWENREQILLPSYVFLYTEQDQLPVNLRAKAQDLYTILQYDHGVRTLTGADSDYAQWIFRHQGNIKPSKVLAEGETIKIIDGPLLDCQGKIVKLDKHKRRAWVEFEFDGMKRVVSMGVEWVEERE